MMTSTLSTEFKKQLLELGVFSIPNTLNDLKEILRPFNIGFDMRYMFNEYRTYICDRFSNNFTKHQNKEDALKQLYSTIISKLKLINKK